MPGTSVRVFPRTELSSGDVLVSDGSATVTVSGALRITSGSLTNNGNLDVPGQLAMEGGDQIDGTTPFHAGTLRINTPDGVVVYNEVTVEDSMMMQHGVVTVDTSTPLHFGLSATSPEEWHDSYIEGRAIMDARQVGGGALPPFLGCSITGGSDLGSVSIIRTTGPEAIISEGGNESIAANWQVRTSVNPALPNRHMTFFWLPVHDNGKNTSAMDLYGSLLGRHDYEKVNTNSISAGDKEWRVYTQHRIGRFNQTFTLSDIYNPLTEPAVGQSIKRIFPNPFTDHLEVEMENTRDYPVQVRIVSADGRLVYQGTHQPANNTLHLDNLGYLPQGNYWIQMYTHGSTVATHIIKID